VIRAMKLFVVVVGRMFSDLMLDKAAFDFVDVDDACIELGP
jgi:hypothetical protein